MNSEIRIIDYLYGEMSSAERDVFEKEMEENPELKAEVEAMQDTQGMLQEVKEELAPEIPVLPLTPKAKRLVPWTWMVGVAASLLLILTFFNTEVTYESGKLSLAFGHSDRAAEQEVLVIDTTMVATIAHSMIREYMQKMDHRINHLDSAWKQDLMAHNDQIKTQWAQQFIQYDRISQQKMALFKDQLKSEQMPEMANLFHQIQLEQRQDLEEMMNGMWNEWQKTRYNDLESIGSAFSDIYDDVAQNRNETEALVSGLISRNGD